VSTRVERAREVTFSRMRRRHVPRVLAIEGEVFPRPWAMALFLSELGSPQTRSYFVAEHGHDVIGYAGLMMLERASHFMNAAVTPGYQGLRIGAKLFYILVEEALARGSERIVLEVRQDNVHAQHIYERFGFKPIDLRRGYYFETGEDGLVMALDGVQSPAYRELLAESRRTLGDVPGDWSQPVDL
jgi:[ribosomal protein S18]-alanine N-acetyltransferase